MVTDPTLFSHRGVISNADISCLVIPDGCIGLPTLAALEQGIPVIAVRGNKNAMRNDLSKLPWIRDQLYLVDNYWEAAGVMSALRAGVPPAAVRRPLANAELALPAKSTAELKMQTARRPSPGMFEPPASPDMPAKRDGCVLPLPDRRKDWPPN
jgi:D-aminopeptidase